MQRSPVARNTKEVEPSTHLLYKELQGRQIGMVELSGTHAMVGFSS